MLRVLLFPFLFATAFLQAQTAKLDLLNSVQVQGFVSDSLTGKPVYDCLVEYYTIEGQRKAVSSVNEDGRYSMFIPVGKPFELRITKENGYCEMRRNVEAVPFGVKEFRKDLYLQPHTVHP